jgi:hypothetical protein
MSSAQMVASWDLLTRTGHAAVRAILALNRVYLPHRQLKWQRHLTTGLGLSPSGSRSDSSHYQMAGPWKHSRQPRHCWPRS